LAVAVPLGCVRRSLREEQGRAAAMSQAAEDISRLTAERNLYRDLSAKAHGLMARAHREREAAFVRGIKLGHASVNCLPSWPAIDTEGMETLAEKSIPAPLPAPSPEFIKYVKANGR
jgi:hypothetical protein